MAAAVPIISVRCHYCSNPRHPKEIVNLGESALMCWQCWEKHVIAVDVFARNPPDKCSLCERTFESLQGDHPGRDYVPMYPHWIEGGYHMLCENCDRAYVAKRRDLYGDTRFGWDRKLK